MIIVRGGEPPYREDWGRVRDTRTWDDPDGHQRQALTV